MLSRRVVLRSAPAAAMGLLSAGAAAPDAAQAAEAQALSGIPLKTLAASRRLVFGSEVVINDLRFDADYEALVRSQCAQITPGVEFKWGYFQPRPEIFRAGAARWLLTWAKQAGVSVRGHTLIWHRNMPDWAPAALSAAPRQIFDQRVRGMATLFRGQVAEWDVVNEALKPEHGRPDGLRSSLFVNLLGSDYIARAFEVAHEADPQARLYYNDFGFETSSSEHEAKRVALLRLLERLLHRGTPIHGVGIQGHLFSHQRVDDKAFGDLLRRIGQMGLAIKITEFDVRDRFPAWFPGRDGRSARATRRFFDVALAEPAVRGVTVWGLSDRYSYLRREEPDVRPTPYDQDFRPKAVRDAIAGAMAARRR